MLPSPAPGRLATPPRTVSPRLAAQLLLSGINSQIGWLLFGFGSIFFWGFAAHADLSGWRFRPGAIAYVSGQSLNCTDTHYSVGGSENSRGTPVYANRYSYVVGHQSFEAVSYATGDCRAGGPVEIEYLLADPASSRISGMRRDFLGPWALLVAILPGAGLAWVIAGLVKGRRAVRLLREGMATTARLTEKVPTNSTVNSRRVYRMTFEYAGPMGAAEQLTIRTSLPERLENDEHQLVLCDPLDGRTAVLFNNLPGPPAFDPTGQPVATGRRAFLFLPLLTVAGNAWFILRHWK